MEAWRVCRTVVGDSHHLDEEQDPYLSENWIWIHTKIKMRIGNPVYKNGIKLLKLHIKIIK